jgi:hypothetical protein
MRMLLVMSAVLTLCGCADAARCAGPLVPINATAGAAVGSARSLPRAHASRSIEREREQP